MIWFVSSNHQIKLFYFVLVFSQTELNRTKLHPYFPGNMESEPFPSSLQIGEEFDQAYLIDLHISIHPFILADPLPEP